jgi:cell wall-associated NlpC family hydrolase
MADRLAYADLIGTPFEYGGRGPQAFDCWGLVMECYRRVHGVVLPDLRSPSDPAVQAAMAATMMQQTCWERVSPAPGAIVALRVGRLITHVGFALEDDKLIHAWKQTGGVTVNPIAVWQHRIEGFYRYAA